MGFFHLILFAIILTVGASPTAQAQSSNDRPKVAFDDVELEGTLLPKAVQEQLVASLKQRVWEEDSNWVADAEHMVTGAETDGWPDKENQGYLGFSVSARWKPLRREPGLLHVLVAFHVNEGQPKRLEKIEFRYVDHVWPPGFSSDRPSEANSAERWRKIQSRQIPGRSFCRGRCLRRTRIHRLHNQPDYRNR